MQKPNNQSSLTVLSHPDSVERTAAAAAPVNILLVPLLEEKIPILQEQISKNKHCALLLVDCSFMSELEKHFGNAVFETILRKAEEIIASFPGTLLRKSDLIVKKSLTSNVYMIFLSAYKRSARVSKENVLNSNFEILLDRIESSLNIKLLDTYYSLTHSRPKFRVGYALGMIQEKMKFARFLEKMEAEALESSKLNEKRVLARYRVAMHRLMIEERLRTVFQPIYTFNNVAADLSLKEVLEQKQLYSYEALSRGPKGSEFESAFMLFQIAQECDLQFDLDLICWSRALKNAQGCKNKIFLNTYASTLQEPLFEPDQLLRFISVYNFRPDQIVLELSEKQSITNMEIYQSRVNKIRKMGVQVALDDVGSGYSGLENIIRLQPDYLKLDITLVHGLHLNEGKRNIVKAICEVAAKMGSITLAEGVETFEELAACRQLGVRLFQGFLLARPMEISFEENKKDQLDQISPLAVENKKVA